MALVVNEVYNGRLKRKIMEKKGLFVLVFAMLFVGMAVSSCSSDDEESANSVVPPDNPIYGDYLKEVKGETATVFYENWSRNWILLDSDGHRYYFFLSSDNVDHEYFDSLVKNEVLADGAHVKFDGKVYSTSDGWRESTANWLDWACHDKDALEYAGGYLPSKAEWLQNNSKEKAFVLMEPYTITKTE